MGNIDKEKEQGQQLWGKRETHQDSQEEMIIFEKGHSLER